MEQGESRDLSTRVDGGPVVTRDRYVEDAYQIEDHRGELYREEIRELAELAGLL